jgi:hypothetical protein
LAKKKSTEIRLLPPRRVALSPTQEQEAVSLLAELLAEAAAKRRGLLSGGALDGASGGAIGSVIALPETRRKAREAA